jgi:transcriptional regulator with XRE-family HTH domain
MTRFRDITGIIIGRNIEFRRRQLGITDDQFSKCLGIELDVLKKYESGVLRVNAKLLLTIGQILDTPPQYFFSIKDPLDANLPCPEASDGSFEKDRARFLREGMALNRAFVRISNSENRKALVDIALALADIDRLVRTAL